MEILFMKLLKQLAFLFILCLVGELISSVLPFAFPAGIISMIILLILLLCKAVKSEQISDVSDFLLSNMAFFFIPAAVNILENVHLIADKILPFFIICLVSTVVTFAVSAGVCTLCINLQNKLGGQKDE